MNSSSTLLQLQGVSKRYGGVRALDNVDFACAAGSIHAVLGENGAGKSTLIKIISGVVQPDTGTMTLQGEPVTFASPSAASRRGVVCVFQELSLIPDLSVADNICLTDPPVRNGLIDIKAQRERTEKLLATLGCEDIHPLELVKNLPLSRRQMVEIAKALGRSPKLLILDEATSALAASDVEKIYKILGRLRSEGLGILYISHRMAEIKALADTCSVFRNGRHVETFKSGSRSDADVVKLMIGRDLAKTYPPKPPLPAQAPTRLAVSNMSWNERLYDISFNIRAGEIIGLGGLDGQGQRELLLALFGVLRGIQGKIEIQGRDASGLSPAKAKSPKYGVALIPEDRKIEGLILPMAIDENMTLAALKKLSRAGWISGERQAAAVQKMIETLRIKIGNVSDPVHTLSGGNQQKVVIGKWLMTGAQVILLNDPTRGIDVGTKQEIYALLRDLAAQGVAILLYSTDYDELVGLADRVLIMYGGRIGRVLENNDINEHNIVAASLNLSIDSHAT
jgi:ribose transport system ATP-binding protein